MAYVNIRGQTGGGISFPDAPSAGDTPLFATVNRYSTDSTAYTNVGPAITINKGGTYRFTIYYLTAAGATTVFARYTKNGTLVSGSESSTINTVGLIKTIDITCSAGDVIRLQMMQSTTGAARAYCYGMNVTILAADVQSAIDEIIAVS